MKSDLATGLLASVPLPLVLVGADAWIAACNPAAVTLLGEGIVGRPFQMAMRQPGLAAAIEACLASGQGSVTRHVAGDQTIWRVTVSPVQDGAACFFEDVTEAESIGRMRRDFVANVSHELRSPLTALLGFVETLQGAARDDPAARARFLGVMSREAQRMNRLVGDLLSLSRVEADERVRPATQVDLSAIASSCVASLRPLAENAKVRVTLVGAEAPLFAPADADQITQVLGNLLENAVKYGGGGGEVTLRLDTVALDPVLRQPALSLVVEDRGEGIAAVHLPRLTERFYRVDTHRSRAKGGTGLGLAIVKHIIARHRGRLKIDSTPGQGSRFSVFLPRG